MSTNLLYFVAEDSRIPALLACLMVKPLHLTPLSTDTDATL